MTYDKAAVEPNDIDLVTVEAKFDVAELYRRFQASFAGVDVQKEEWRDPCLAKPIFAAVQLERQELQEDGAWSAWQPLPRSRVEANRDLFKVYERISDLPAGGLDVRLMQFNRDDITIGAAPAGSRIRLPRRKRNGSRPATTASSRICSERRTRRSEGTRKRRTASRTIDDGSPPSEYESRRAGAGCMVQGRGPAAAPPAPAAGVRTLRAAWEAIPCTISAAAAGIGAPAVTVRAATR